jgi:hypothetical protein
MTTARTLRRWLALALLAACAAPVLAAPAARTDLQPVVPPDQRGRLDAERSGYHDAANIRTVFWNFGMVGDYPADPINVDLSVFHSVEVPKGSGMNYCDGITPFVLAKIHQADAGGSPAYIMETGFRERQGISPYHNRIMRFEPRPGYFQSDPLLNVARSPAISSDPRTWPPQWPDRATDPDDPGWGGSWDGYFGKRPAADQESYTVMDDDFYDAWYYFPDSRDSSRKGLGLRVGVRGFQWANPQAGNVVFWHYDITNESTTDYDDDIIFGLYMDSGVGGSAISCDGVAESDDDNAFWDRSRAEGGSRLNLVYTWDKNGHGRDLDGNCSPTGYLGYAYLETPGNPFDGVDNDDDGITDEQRDGGPGQHIIGQEAIRAYVTSHYDLAKFETTYGALEKHAPFKRGDWWTGDEDMDWNQEFDDVGADGVPGTGDTGEGDGIPTDGEPRFDRTDLHESDQIGLTGFKLNRIAPGLGSPSQDVDGILFYTEGQAWPERLYNKFTDPDPAARFDSALVSNYNIGFLFASGPFKLRAGQTERFSLALAYGADLVELRSTVATVQQIYNGNYQFAVPPPMPTLAAESGDGFVRLSWDDVAERGVDPVSNENDFEGYKIYRSTDPEFRDPQVITTGRGTDIGLRRSDWQFDLVDGRRGYSTKAVEGVQFWLGSDTGIRHTFTDTTVVNGQEYYYGIAAYDFGVDSPFDSLRVYPSQNAIAVTGTPRGGFVLPKNVVRVRPNPRVPGFRSASATIPAHVLGGGIGSALVQVVNSNQVPDGHLMKIQTFAPSADSIRANRYTLTDSTAGTVCFANGDDFNGATDGAVGCGLLPILSRPAETTLDPSSGYRAGSPAVTPLRISYQPSLDPNLRRPGYPDSITIEFDDVVRDTSTVTGGGFPAKPAKFRVIAHTATGDQQLNFRFRDSNNDGWLSYIDVASNTGGVDSTELIDILTYDPLAPTLPRPTWRIELDTPAKGPIPPPRLGDLVDIRVRTPLSEGDVFTFTATAKGVATAQGFPTAPYVVPNPYIGAASFEPARFATSGRGERRIEFRGIPIGSTIRVYNVRGDLVQTLRQEGAVATLPAYPGQFTGSDAGIVAWDLRTKDNLDLAPGLYIFHVDAPGVGTHVGKFAVIK